MDETKMVNTVTSTCPSCQQQMMYGQQGLTPQQQTATTNSITDNPMYTQGYLRQQIGKFMRVQFLIGTNSLQDRTGILSQVGNSYIVLRSLETGTDIFCDIYSIKFVTIASQQLGMFGGMVPA